MVSRVQVNGSLEFSEARLADTERLGPAVVAQALRLDRVRFGRAVQIEAAANNVMCQHAAFARHATLLLRYAQVILGDLLLAEPLTIAAAEPFTAPGQTAPMGESLIGTAPGEAKPCLVSLVGVDCSLLVLTDIDLSHCHFAGTHHLDQLRIEGSCRFASAPTGWIFGKAGHRPGTGCAGKQSPENTPGGRRRLTRLPGPRPLDVRATAATPRTGTTRCLVSPTAQGPRGRQERTRSGRLLLRRDGDAPPLDHNRHRRTGHLCSCTGSYPATHSAPPALLPSSPSSSPSPPRCSPPTASPAEPPTQAPGTGWIKPF